jgi:hypothetical protein
MPHLPIVFKWCYPSLLGLNSFECNHYPKSERGALHRFHDSQLLMFADQLSEMDRWAIDTEMAYLQGYLLIPADNPQLQWRVCNFLQPLSCCDWTIRVSNSSGPSLRVQVRVQTEPWQHWRSGLSINPNCPPGYSSMVKSQPVGIGRVVSRSPSRSIY